MFHGFSHHFCCFAEHTSAACHRWHHGVAASGHHAVGVGGRGGGAPGEAGESRGGAAEEQVGGVKRMGGVGPVDPVGGPFLVAHPT